MLSDVIISHLRAAASVQQSPWQVKGLVEVAARWTPDCFFGDHAVIVRADVGVTWARWFLEGICDPEAYVKDHPCFPAICGFRSDGYRPAILRYARADENVKKTVAKARAHRTHRGEFARSMVQTRRR